MNWLKQQVANVTGTAEPIYGPSALQSVAEQAKGKPYTELTRNDFKWTALDHTNVETQVFYIMAKGGHYGMAQVIYSNIAGIRTTTQFNCKIFYPDGSKPHHWSPAPLNNHGFSEDGISFFADNVSVELNEAGDSYTIKSAANDDCLVNLKVTRTAPAFCAGKDGKSYFGTDPKNPWGSMHHKFWPRCISEGQIITKDGPIDFQGRALFIHALQGMKPHHAAAKWNFLDFQSPTYSAVMMEFTTPPSYGSSSVNVGGIAIDGQILVAGCDNKISHTETREDPDWPQPGALHLEWNGTTKEGKSVKAVLAGSLGTRIDKVDVMAEVPGFVKAIVGGVVGTRPFIFQFAPQPRLTLKITIDGVEKSEEGDIFCESTFISE